MKYLSCDFFKFLVLLIACSNLHAQDNPADFVVFHDTSEDPYVAQYSGVFQEQIDFTWRIKKTIAARIPQKYGIKKVTLKNANGTTAMSLEFTKTGYYREVIYYSTYKNNIADKQVQSYIYSDEEAVPYQKYRVISFYKNDKLIYADSIHFLGRDECKAHQLQIKFVKNYRAGYFLNLQNKFFKDEYYLQEFYPDYLDEEGQYQVETYMQDTFPTTYQIDSLYLKASLIYTHNECDSAVCCLDVKRNHILPSSHFQEPDRSRQYEPMHESQPYYGPKGTTYNFSYNSIGLLDTVFATVRKFKFYKCPEQEKSELSEEELEEIIDAPEIDCYDILSSTTKMAFTITYDKF